MKKLLAIAVLGLLWSGNVHAKEIKFSGCRYEAKLKVKNNPPRDWIVNTSSKTVYRTNVSNNVNPTLELESIGTDQIITEIVPWFKEPNILFQYTLIPSQKIIRVDRLRDKNYFNKKKPPNIVKSGSHNLECERIGDNISKTASQSAEMSFTIKDKREQCEAIGFKPKTEKFADCVLRLVELDIKKQQDNKIAAAQNSGNMQIANQLLQMRNDNNAQYLIDLGQQLLTPQSFNSNIYLPQTQNCTIMGFDSFAKMTCN